MRCKNKQNEDCGLMPWERPDFCDELCEEYIPADLPEAGASAERISAVIYILRQIEKQSDRLREIAIELKEISDRIK